MEPSPRSSTEQEIDLATLWRRLLRGEFFVSTSYRRDSRCFAILKRSQRESKQLSPRAVVVLERVLAGESQKALAYELGLTSPTVASYCSETLREFAYEHLSSRAPLLLVMAAVAARGVQLPGARLEETLEDGSWVVSVETPGSRYTELLSPSERDVARSTIEGKTHAQIAQARGTSTRTVANQLASIFTKLHTCGRSELRAKAVADCAKLAATPMSDSTGQR